MRANVRSWLVVVGLISFSCNREERDGTRLAWSHGERGPTVATVNGIAIGLKDVRELVSATGLSPEQALRRLEDDVLLTEHANDHGYQRSTLQGQETRRALVRALLAQTVESEVRPESIPLQQVQERFDASRERNKLSPESFPMVEGQIRQQLVLEQRQAALAKLVARLRSRFGVVLDEAEVDELLRDKTLWGGSS